MANGVSKVYRGGELLGKAWCQFRLHQDGSVTGSLTEVSFRSGPPGFPQIPMTFMDHEAGSSADLRLQLKDGRWVQFMCAHSSGEVAHGRLIPSEALDDDDTPSH